MVLTPCSHISGTAAITLHRRCERWPRTAAVILCSYTKYMQCSPRDTHANHYHIYTYKLKFKHVVEPHGSSSCDWCDWCHLIIEYAAVLGVNREAWRWCSSLSTRDVFDMSFEPRPDWEPNLVYWSQFEVLRSILVPGYVTRLCRYWP